MQRFSRSVVPAAGKKVKDQVFAFDRIFDENASQMDVYEDTTKGLLDSVLDGYNATVFAYGATGCGKTHTITGTAQQPGIIFLTMQELFEKINERSEDKATELSLSYLEIYNETIRDLLVPGGSKQGLMLREDTNQAVTVAGLTSHHPRNVQEVMDMIVHGNEYRTVSPTEANAVSSRSHAVLQINIAQRDRNASVNEPHTMATLSIIDLAGSERASATKNRGERLLEGANINKSLLALGGCINALCDPRKRNHVPYRNSKLTRLLKFSLGGNCKTVMIVCVSPSSAHFDETQNTLRYANRAKNIQTKVTRNVFNVNRHVKDFLVKIDEQMALIKELKAQQKDAENAFGLKVRKQLDKRDAIAREGIQRIRVAFENALPERQQKVSDMKKLRCIERRIAVLSAWADAFDGFQDLANEQDVEGDDSHSVSAPQRRPEDIPVPLVAMRKTARGILAELEHSRNHLHHKIERGNWERPVDSALQHSIAQVSAVVSDSVAADTTEAIASLTRETELLKANFAREAYLEVLEQEKTNGSQGDMLMMQTLLAAQFGTLSSLSSTISLPRDEAVIKGQRLIRRLVETGVAAACSIVKPDASFSAPAGPMRTGPFAISTSSATSFSASTSEVFPPSKRGTPRRKRSMGGSMGVAPSRASIGVLSMTSPTKSSPRRRKVVTGTARKGISFTPVKKKSTSIGAPSTGNASTASFKRSVRWRDNATEEGTLADFEKTPKKFAQSSPEEKNATFCQSSGQSDREACAEDTAGDQGGSRQLQESSWTTMETVPEEEVQAPPSPELPSLALPAYLGRTDLVETTDDEDSSLHAPDVSSLPGTDMASAASAMIGKPSRFQAGFLAKSRPSQQGGSLALPLSLGDGGGYVSSSDGDQPQPPSLSNPNSAPTKSTPLRSISVPQAANQQRSPPSAMRITSLNGTAGSPKPFLSTVTDENSPLSQQQKQMPPTRLRSPSPRLSLSAANSDSEAASDLTLTIDTQKLRSALHSAKKAAASTSTNSSSTGTRRFSVGGAHLQHHHHYRASASYSGPAVTLASSTNGISLQRRRSAERRRSPPIACSPLVNMSDVGSSASSGASGLRDGAISRALTPGQARRMNMGGSLRGDSSSGGAGSGSPRERGRDRLAASMEPPSNKAMRRVTIGTAAMGGLGGGTGKKDTAAASRPGVAWR